MSLLCTLHDMSITGASVKWPNDVWVRGHKLAGFLAEHGGILPGKYRDLAEINRLNWVIFAML